MKIIASLCLFFICCVTCSHAQTPAQNISDYCKTDSAATFALIGKQAKIDKEGGVYSTLNLSESLQWPSAEMKKLGGKSGWKKYKPATGDTGTIVHIFVDNGSTSKFIYLLKIKEIYVPVGCACIAEAMPEKM
jgi:hypothetical protein